MYYPTKHQLCTCLWHSLQESGSNDWQQTRWCWWKQSHIHVVLKMPHSRLMSRLCPKLYNLCTRHQHLRHLQWTVKELRAARGRSTLVWVARSVPHEARICRNYSSRMDIISDPSNAPTEPSLRRHLHRRARAQNERLSWLR